MENFGTGYLDPMGITGLLPIVRPTMKKRHISHYKNRRIGIDGHVWLHGVVSMVATEIFHYGGTDKHVPLLLKRIKDLQRHGIIPVVVFDGDPNIAKEKTNIERRAQRQKLRDEAEFFLQQGNTARAHEAMKRSISITPQLLASAMSGLRSAGIEYIVSPYEADPQLVFLERINYIDGIMTIDSDLIAFEARCILYNYNGSHVEEYHAERLVNAKDSFFARRICDICILSGCDYAESIKGVGLQTAHKKLRECGSVETFVESMRVAGKPVPADYLDQFYRAKLSFTHHIIYNPVSSTRQHLGGDIPDGCGFLGTLENLPYKIKNELGDDIHLDRHFKPALLNIVKTDIRLNEDKGTNKQPNIILDENVTSKYFE